MMSVLRAVLSDMIITDGVMSVLRAVLSDMSLMV